MIKSKSGALPERIILDLTSRCNLKCNFCARSAYKYRYRDLSWLVFKKVVPFLPFIKEATLLGWGEPLMYMNFKKIFNKLSSVRGLKTYLVTNGILLHEVAELVVKNRLTFLGISIDGVTKKTYEKIRKGAKFSRLIKNIRLLNKLKEKYKSNDPYIRFVFVASKENIEELPNLIKLAAIEKITEVKVVYLTVYDRKIKDLSLWFHRKLTEEFFKRAQDKASKLSIILTLPPIIGKGDLGDRFHRECNVAWKELYIGCDGKVRPCHVATKTLGDLNSSSIIEIWQSKDFQFFRDSVNGISPPLDCRNCCQCNRLNVNRYSAHFRFESGIPLTLKE